MLSEFDLSCEFVFEAVGTAFPVESESLVLTWNFFLNSYVPRKIVAVSMVRTEIK